MTNLKFQKFKLPVSLCLSLLVFVVSFCGKVPLVSAQTAGFSLVSLTSNPTSGFAPLTGLTMTATITGTFTGTLNYYFYCSVDPANGTISPVPGGYSHSIIGTTSMTGTMPAGRCDTVYANPGTYTSKVIIIDSSGAGIEARRAIYVFNPIPTVNLRICPYAEANCDPEDWFNEPITAPYNSEATIEWTFSSLIPNTSCIMSGAWSGIKTVPGQESLGYFTSAGTYIYTLTCETTAGTLSDSAMITIDPPTLFGSLSVTPTNSGIAPLTGRILNASVTGGTAVGTVNYTFYCDRSDTGTNITSDDNYKLDGTNLLTVSTLADTCNSVYANVGNYTAKVIIERGGIARQYQVNVTVNAPPAPTINLTANPASPIPYNSSTTIGWTVDYATSCTPSAGPVAWTSSGAKAIPTGTWSTGNLVGPASYTYTLTCTGLGGTRSASITINVNGPPDPPLVRLRANLSDVPITVPYGAIVNLEWQTIGDTVRCVASGDWSGDKHPSSSQENTEALYGPGQYIYILTCYDAFNQSGWDQAIVNVLSELPTINYFTADPISVDCGSASELSWSATNDIAETNTVCAISGGMTIAGLPSTGSVSTGNLTSPQNYILTCYNIGGQVTRSASVSIRNVAAPTINSFTATPSSIEYNSTSQLSWNASTNSCSATTCSITGGTLNRIGLSYAGNITTPVLIATQAYTLTCSNAGGQVSQQVTVTVGNAPAPTIDRFEASDTSIDYGGSVRLEWSSTNTTSCEAFSELNAWNGAKLTDGSQTIYGLEEDESFTLTCTGLGGTTAPRILEITVGAAPEAKVTVTARASTQDTYSANTLTVDCGTAIDIKWEVTGAEECWRLGDWSYIEIPAYDGTYRTQGLTEEGEYYYEVFCFNPDVEIAEDSIDVTVRECPEDLPIIFNNPINQSDFRNILDSLSGLIRMIAIALAAIMIVVSGIIILTSIDDRERLNKGKNMLKWSLVGLAIALASSYIIGLLEEIINNS